MIVEILLKSLLKSLPFRYNSAYLVNHCYCFKYDCWHGNAEALATAQAAFPIATDFVMLLLQISAK
jgi:hypothetical protein